MDQATGLSSPLLNEPPQFSQLKDHLFVCVHAGFKHESDSGVHLRCFGDWMFTKEAVVQVWRLGTFA